MLFLITLFFNSCFGSEMAVTSAVQLPQPLTLGVQLTGDAHPDWSAFYEAGFFKFPLTSSTRSVSTYSMETGVRYHPFSNWFYVEGELGFRQLSVSVDITNLKQDGVSLASAAIANLGTVYSGVLVGGEWRLAPKFALAFDLGVQLALLHTGGITIVTLPGQDDGTDNSVSDKAEMKRISGLPLPQIAVFRLVWYI